MPRPEEWKGRDLTARAEVCHWLADRGGEVHDPKGLLTGTMRADLGKGRAISQLISDMVKDGMIAREMNARRTMMLKLLDDWGTLAEYKPKANGKRPAVAAAADPEPDLANVDLTLLAEALLVQVIKRAQVQPSQGAAVEKLREQVATLKGEVAELRDNLILARDSEAEQRRNADAMRESLAKLQRSMAATKREGVPLIDHLSQSGKKLLSDLAGSLPSGS